MRAFLGIFDQLLTLLTPSHLISTYRAGFTPSSQALIGPNISSHAEAGGRFQKILWNFFILMGKKLISLWKTPLFSLNLPCARLFAITQVSENCRMIFLVTVICFSARQLSTPNFETTIRTSVLESFSIINHVFSEFFYTCLAS